MKLYTNNSLAGVLIFVSMVSCYLFFAGFEPGFVWSRAHVAELCICLSSLVAAAYFAILGTKEH